MLDSVLPALLKIKNQLNMIQISIILLFSTVKEGTDKNRHI